MRLAVVIPTYNEQDTIGPCLDHLLGQDVDEVIVVDNNSVDDTLEIVARYQETDSRIVVRHEPVQGLIATRNNGFDSTDADILGRIDADTRVAADWVEQVRTFFEENPDFSGVSGMSLFYDAPFRPGRRWIIRQLVRAGVLGRNRSIDNIHGANMAIRNAVWRQVRDRVTTRRDIHEDIDLALCILDIGGSVASSDTIWAEISPRRNLEPPWSYRGHMRAGIESYRLHGRSNWFFEWVFIPISWSLHAVMWVPYRGWDPVRGRWSVRRLFTPIDYRVSGMG